MDFGVFLLATENVEEDGRSEGVADQTYFAFEIWVALKEKVVDPV